MKRRMLVVVLLAALVPSRAADGGHGFGASFASIEWLPDPGRTPDEWLYPLDAWREARELRRADGPRATIEVALAIAREKLAELEAMVRTEDGDAARTAFERYRENVALVESTLESARDSDDVGELAALVCQALLEHQFILSVDYEILPASHRHVLVDAVREADDVYRGASPALAREDRDPFRFKENEVRWSLRAALGSALERSKSDR